MGRGRDRSGVGLSKISLQRGGRSLIDADMWVSTSTEAALAAAKVRGTKLGSPDPLAALIKANEAKRLRPPAEHVIDLMAVLRTSGRSYQQVANQLNAHDIRTPQASRWYRIDSQRCHSFALDRSVPLNPASDIRIAF